MIAEALEARGVSEGPAFIRLTMTRPLGLSRHSTYGEIARTRGMRGFHNQTLVVLSIA